MDVTRTREAFDRHALTYDERFSSLATAQAIRRQVWCIADGLFPSGSRLLDLGCGTGDDAIHFAERGIHVTSIDISPGMIAQLLLKAEAAGLQGQIVARIANLETFQPEKTDFNGLFSNFGALNCVPEVSGLRSLASKVLKHGSPVVLVTMGRFYPLETLLFLLKGDLRRAFRRLRRKTEVAVENIRVPVWYHGLKDLQRSLGPTFELQRVQGLRSVDRALEKFPALGSWSDHFVSVWRYR